jgi:hypothetical protein
MAKQQNSNEESLQEGESLQGRTGGMVTGLDIHPEAEAHYGEVYGKLGDDSDNSSDDKRRVNTDPDNNDVSDTFYG